MFFDKEQIEPSALSSSLVGYDRFVSAYNTSARVKTVFQEISATSKHWIVLAEYRIGDLPSDSAACVFTSAAIDEAEVMMEYFDTYPLQANEKVCFDATGFIRPHLLFLINYLHHHGVNSVDVIYSEPICYVKGSGTQFSRGKIDVRPVRTFEGNHSLDTEGDYLIVGCGYDTTAMHAVANRLKHMTKLQLFPFPALRPHMYQENRLKTEECQVAFGQVLEHLFAPGYDPFATAETISRVVNTHRSDIKNLYLSPLSTKAQVIGFAWFYLMECLNEGVSMMFPFTESYNQETSVGLSEVWRYRLDFTLLRSLQSSFRTRTI